MDTPIIVGTEWLVEASGCDSSALGDEVLLKSVFDAVIHDLGLKTVDRPIWHKFPGAGGVTGLVALTESHLACHTYPEHGIATFNLYCCKDRPIWDWEKRLGEFLGAVKIKVTKIERSTADADSSDALQEKKPRVKIVKSAAGGSW